MEARARAVFLDRDGTVSEEVGYIHEVERFRLYPFAPPAIRKLNQAGLRAVLVTNQAGVARGHFTEALVTKVHRKLTRELAAGGARLDAIYYCPHHPEAGEPPYRQDCNCRKPKTGMLERAALDLRLDLARSFVVGDRYRDVELAFRTGGISVLVLTGYGRREYDEQSRSWPRQPDHVAEDILAACEWIVSTL